MLLRWVYLKQGVGGSSKLPNLSPIHYFWSTASKDNQNREITFIFEDVIWQLWSNFIPDIPQLRLKEDSSFFFLKKGVSMPEALAGSVLKKQRRLMASHVWFLDLHPDKGTPAWLTSSFAKPSREVWTSRLRWERRKSWLPLKTLSQVFA